MIESDKKEFAQTMKLAAIVYERDCDQPMLRAYFEFLEEYSVEQIKVAVKAHCTGTGIESKFFPKVADITAQIHGSKKGCPHLKTLSWRLVLGLWGGKHYASQIQTKWFGCKRNLSNTTNHSAKSHWNNSRIVFILMEMLSSLKAT